MGDKEKLAVDFLDGEHKKKEFLDLLERHKANQERKREAPNVQYERKKLKTDGLAKGWEEGKADAENEEGKLIPLPNTRGKGEFLPSVADVGTCSSGHIAKLESKESEHAKVSIDEQAKAPADEIATASIDEHAKAPADEHTEAPH